MQKLFSLFVLEKVFAEDVIGSITSKIPNPYGNVDDPTRGLGLLIANGLRLFFVVAGILAFINFILAGFQYMMAAGDSKALQAAWDRIWYSLLGLILMVGAFALAAVFGYLLFNDPGFMLRPVIYTP